LANPSKEIRQKDNNQQLQCVSHPRLHLDMFVVPLARDFLS
jgi:hypothetical protein